MHYDEMVKRLAALSGVPGEDIRKVMFFLPDVLVRMQKGDILRTSLGVFRVTHKKSRLVSPPGRDQAFPVTEEMVVKLRSGNRLRRRP